MKIVPQHDVDMLKAECEYRRGIFDVQRFEFERVVEGEEIGYKHCEGEKILNIRFKSSERAQIYTYVK